MAEVVLEGIAKTYAGGVEAVRGVSLRVADGELIALVGPSGSGKTTLLRLIAGLEAPTAGVLRIGERIVTDLPPHRRDVAMVFQRPALYPHLNVRANLGFGLSLRRGLARWRPRGDHKIEERIAEVARQLGLEEVLERRPATLSGGQQQRVALGRALVRRPAVFLLDEPLSNLDARLRLEMRRELHLLHRRLRATMIYVTHDQDEAMALGERVVVLDQGVVRQADRPQTLYDQPADRFVAGFLGWPPMNLLPGRLIAASGVALAPRENSLDTRGADATPLADTRGADATPLAFDNRGVRLVLGSRPDWQAFLGQPLLLGIRPEDVALAAEPGEGRLGMEVRLIERLGPVGLVTLAAADWSVTARTEPHAVPREGETVFAAFDLQRAHLFDPATGRAMRN